MICQCNNELSCKNIIYVHTWNKFKVYNIEEIDSTLCTRGIMNAQQIRDHKSQIPFSGHIDNAVISTNTSKQKPVQKLFFPC